MVFKRKKKDEVANEVVQALKDIGATIINPHDIKMSPFPPTLPFGIIIEEAVMFDNLIKELKAQCNSGHITANDKIWGAIQYLHNKYAK